MAWLRPRFRPFAVGFATAAAIGCLLVGAYVFVDRVLFSDVDGVTPDEVVTSAINGYLADHDVPAGSQMWPTVRYLGDACGGAVELRVGPDPAPNGVVYVVTQDSGDALPATQVTSSLDAAVTELRATDARCR
jgi:hypothetical protein